ncbi:unnamed protein product, partial [Meganyctiphanes norvegica]
MRGNNKPIANVVDGNYTNKDIADNFHEKYQNLYSSVPDDEVLNVASKVNNLVNETCNRGLCKSPTCHDITSDILKKAILCLNNGKDDENYNIFSDHFIFASDMFYNFFI